MKKILLASFLSIASISGYAQTYKAITSKNKTYLATLKGVSYTYKDGIITIKNNGKYNLGIVTINAYSKVDSTLFGIALFDDGLEKGKTDEVKVYFTADRPGEDRHELSLKEIDQKNLVFSFDKATREKR
ncbi:hypothetical protein [Pedobacter sp. MR2016-24]|uniref:hypothetical protein n=1 Tax=Pedobacter sp. MR2016-24 TaxID=2994466 RepID=UPI00224564AE|nr:hypothetical protein [Pedobacter sp. MR2016-24]MCX2483079.1 hypothetical protein [Pedobacter sp. MR2016-24]